MEYVGIFLGTFAYGIWREDFRFISLSSEFCDEGIFWDNHRGVTCDNAPGMHPWKCFRQEIDRFSCFERDEIVDIFPLFSPEIVTKRLKSVDIMCPIDEEIFPDIFQTSMVYDSEQGSAYFLLRNTEKCSDLVRDRRIRTLVCAEEIRRNIASRCENHRRLLSVSSVLEYGISFCEDDRNVGLDNPSFLVSDRLECVSE